MSKTIEKVIPVMVSRVNRGGGMETITVKTFPEKELKEGEHFHGESLSFTNKQGDETYKTLDDGEIIEIAVRQKTT